MKRIKADMKYLAILFMLLSVFLGIVTIQYMYKVKDVRIEADQELERGINYMEYGLEMLDTSEDKMGALYISEGYGIIQVSFFNSSVQENDRLYDSLEYLARMTTNRRYIDKIIEENDFHEIRDYLKKLKNHMDDEKFASKFKRIIIENTSVDED